MYKLSRVMLILTVMLLIYYAAMAVIVAILLVPPANRGLIIGIMMFVVACIRFRKGRE
jgi:hypothetical protein